MPRLPALKGRAPIVLTALAAGVLAALAHPPFGFLPGLLGYAILLWSLDNSAVERPLRSAFWRGWLAGLAYFVIGSWWVTEAFMVDAEHQGWMAPFAITIMAAFLAAFWGAAALVYRWSRPAGWTRVLVFAAALCAFEWLRGHPLFPWNLPGETWRAGSAASQFASVVGAYGLSWITVVIAAIPALLIARSERRTGLWLTGGAALTLALLFGYGAHRLSSREASTTQRPLVRILQPDVAQSAKYDEAYFRTIVDKYVTLTARPAAQTPDIVVWPEGAIPAAVEDYLAPDTWTRQAILGALKPGQTLILGGYRTTGPISKPLYYNSLFILRRTADSIVLEGVYDKHRLVPFGEYLPFEDLMGKIGVKQLVHVGDGFTPGGRPKPIAGSATPAFIPLICYEGLFPGYFARGDAAWLVNLSNDAWFGATSGPWQHLNLASYRAIEEGLPMVRATPTGVSAMIDGYGRPVASLGLGQMSVIDAKLPNSLGRTPYSRHGDIPFWLMEILGVTLAVRQIVQRRKS